MIHTDGTPTIANGPRFRADERVGPATWAPPVGQWLAGEVRAALDNWDIRTSDRHDGQALADALRGLAHHAGIDV